MLIAIRALGRQAAWLFLSFLVIVSVLVLLHDLPSRVAAWQREADGARLSAKNLAAIKPALSPAARNAVQEADVELGRLRRGTSVQLDAARIDLVNRKRAATTRVLSSTGIALAAAQGRTDRILESYKALYVDLPLIERAIGLISVRRLNLSKISNYRQQKAALNTAIRRHNERIADYNRRVQRRNSLQADLTGQLRTPVCRQVQLPYFCSRLQLLRELDAQLARDRIALNGAARKLALFKAALSLPSLADEATSGGEQIARQAIATMNRDAALQSSRAGEYVWNQIEDTLRRFGRQAFLIILGAIVLPVLHKLFAFYVVAPMAAAAAPVRLRINSATLRSGSSSVAIDVPLDGNNELLVRSTILDRPTDAQVRSLWLLSWRIPFACLAAGLVNLQRFRSDRTDQITVTGTDHEHFEIALIDIPEGGAVVLQPRALVGLIKPRHQRLVIRRPWRVRWVISWITFQFRYIIFHGPCTLIVQGKRGVRTRQASTGRATNKRLVLGFDASLDYGAARAAAFRPYLFGKASLFDDTFSGSGQYIYEEWPSSEAKGGIWGRGLKGLGDAILSALGI